MFEISGKVKLITEKQTFGSGFEKQEFVITSQEKYPQDLKFELTGDKINLIQSFNVGDGIHVKFNVRGNEYNGKYFVNLRAWDLSAGASGGGQSTPPPVENQNPVAPISQTDLPAEDDLPF